MIYTNKNPTRRSTLKLLAASSASAAIALPQVALAQQSIGTQFATSLARMQLPISPASLQAIRFEETTLSGRTSLFAVVRMDWAPGRRQRAFRCEGESPQKALLALTTQVKETFSIEVQKSLA